MSADGARQEALTHDNFATDHSPAWSPDGTRIAFERNRKIFIINSDGGALRQMTRSGTPDVQPAWSPDGTRIAFARGLLKHEIFAKRVDGTGLVNLTRNAADDTEPSWSPDGTRIAFTSNRTGHYGIFVMNADGSGETELTAAPAEDGAPAWSPDGTRIAFSRRLDYQSYDIFSMTAEGEAQKNLTTHGGYNLEPSWSPDGSKIAFARPNLYGGDEGLFVMSADGSSQTNLARGRAHDPAWSTDGTRLAFALDPGAVYCCFGVQSCGVPPVVGLSLARAAIRIRRSACRPGQIRHARSRRMRGLVIDQHPAPGTPRAHGSCVSLVVSRGLRAG